MRPVIAPVDMPVLAHHADDLPRGDDAGALVDALMGALATAETRGPPRPHPSSSVVMAADAQCSLCALAVSQVRRACPDSCAVHVITGACAALDAAAGRAGAHHLALPVYAPYRCIGVESMPLPTAGDGSLATFAAEHAVPAPALRAGTARRRSTSRLEAAR